MIAKFAKKINEILIQKGIVQKEEAELYQYGIENGIVVANSFFLVLAAAFFGLVACLLSASCLRIDGRGLRILTSRRSSLLIMAYTPCRSFMLVKHRDL